MISALPPLGIHLMHKLANKPIGNLVYGCYAAMASYVVFFLSYKNAFIGHQCTGNYVIFQMGSKLGGAYGIYYYLLLVVGIGLGVKWANEFKNKSKSYGMLQAIRGLILSYFIFLIPTALANTVSVQSRQAIPSVMCGFAVLYALILVFYISPKVATVKDTDGHQFKKA
jgi:glucose uptake protein GlcU